MKNCGPLFPAAFVHSREIGAVMASRPPFYSLELLIKAVIFVSFVWRVGG